MTGDGFRLYGLAEIDVLEALAELGSAAGDLARGGLVGHLPRSVLGPEPELFVPAELARQPVFRGLLDTLGQRTPNLVYNEDRLETRSWHPLAAFLTELLLHSGSGEDPTATAQPGQWLLIDTRGKVEEAVRLWEEIRFHGTWCSMAAGRRQGPSPNTATNTVYLLHMVADPERRSSFQSLVASGFLDPVDRLAAFEVEERLLFLPAKAAPSGRALRAFGRLLLAAPSLFGLATGAQSARRLLAISPHDTAAGTRSVLYPLAGQRFFDKPALTPQPSPQAVFEIHQLETSVEEMKRLRRELRQTNERVGTNRVGYRLELRQTPKVKGSERELERLMEQLVELEHRRAYMESLRQPRPVLMRFTSHQLPALAEAIRSFPRAELAAGRVQYGFQSTRDEQAGWHYLLFKPGETWQSQPTLPWQWNSLRPLLTSGHRQAITFCLDPLWAEHYYRRAGQHMVFVPRGTALFPVLHSLDQQAMDSYLEALVREWFEGREKRLALPSQAFFVFDRSDGTAGGEEIRLQILDQSRFRALREEIGWLNDNLVLQREFGGTRAFVERMASITMQARLEEEMKQRADEAARVFMQTAARVEGAVQEEAVALLAELTAELDRIAGKALAARREIERQNQRLRDAEQALNDLDSAGKELSTAIKTTDQAAEENLTRIKTLGGKFDVLESQWRAQERGVNKSIDTLDERLESLRQKILEMRRTWLG